MAAGDGLASGESAAWQRYFTEIFVSGDLAEVSAAAGAAVAAIRRGEDVAAAKSEGKAAGRTYRKARAASAGTRPPPPPGGPGRGEPAGNRQRTQQQSRSEGWAGELAQRLFATPERWGWRSANLPVANPPPSEPVPTRKPAWSAPPRPDTSALRQARSRAVTRLVWRLGITAVAVAAFVSYRLQIEATVDDQESSVRDIYVVAASVMGAILLIGLVRGLLRVRFAGRAIRSFEGPYLQMVAAEKQRHEQAVAEWESASRRQREHRETARRRADGPLWYPVRPASEPTRVDVVGGDPRRHGWASLLVTLGTSVLAKGHRVAIVDLTGHDVGGGLLDVARAQAMTTADVHFPDDAQAVDPLHGVDPSQLAEFLAPVLTERRDAADLRQERAFVVDLIQRVVDPLSPPITFGRLAAAVQVLRRATPTADELSAHEQSRLADEVGEYGPDEWSGRLLRLVSTQLGTLARNFPQPAGRSLWSRDDVVVVATSGARDDRKELLDRLLVQSATHELSHAGSIDGFLVLAGGDHLGAATLTSLTEHTRHARVRLVLMIDQPQGDMEKHLGMGGAACIMKMYNHRDASIAADFIGRGYRFVINQVTEQVGKSFTDGGGDSFAGATTHGSSAKRGVFRERRRPSSLSETRGHTWTGTRNWSLADNISDSTTTARVHEHLIDPQELLALPETSFVLVDNSGHGRRVAVADGNPGICLLDRVSLTPGDET